ncbi:hypothetical protein Barb4_00366 [Bacteroidales bacterium Barb4]|nr:hypothetical protein Barb4_00366 [Bacteroidales bacterium Barb4]
MEAATIQTFPRRKPRVTAIKSPTSGRKTKKAIHKGKIQPLYLIIILARLSLLIL